jgi:branched-chain amino acid transport system permease protein
VISEDSRAKEIMKRYGSVIGTVLALVIASLVPLFVHSPFYLDLFVTILVNAALGMTFVLMLRTGLVSLGVAAFWGVGAYASVVLVTKLHLSFWVSLPASALITAGVALILSYPLIRSPGFTFAILTAVIGMLFTVAVGNIPFLGGHSGVADIPPPDPIRIPFLPPLEFVSPVQHFYMALFLLVVVVLICRAFYSAWTGRAWTAIGLNYRLGESLGVNVFRYKTMAFVLASGIDGLMGSFCAHYQGFVVPDTYGMFTTIYIQVYTVLGGIGYPLLGPTVGAALMTFFPELFRTTRQMAPVFTGLLLVLLIMFLPKGLLSLLDWRSSVGELVARFWKATVSSVWMKNGAGKR